VTKAGGSLEGDTYLVELVTCDDGGLGHAFEQGAQHLDTLLFSFLQYQDTSLQWGDQKQ